MNTTWLFQTDGRRRIELFVKNALEQFGITSTNNFSKVMYKTGAVIAGGFLTQIVKDILTNTTNPAPIHSDSDLDIWIALPNMTFKDAGSDTDSSISHCFRAYTECILDIWERFLCEQGYTTHTQSITEYTNLGFRGHSNIYLIVYSFYNTSLKRKIQIIFGGAPTKEIVRQFDLNCTRHMLYFGYVPPGSMYLESTKEAHEAIIAKKFKVYRMEDNTLERINKYIERYGFTYEGVE
jgi:hypothetical protein